MLDLEQLSTLPIQRRSGVRRGGRISSATTTQITVDDSDATDLSAENNPKLSVIMPNGTVETKNVTGI